MGGFAVPAIKDAAEDVGRDLVERAASSWKEELPGYFRSLRGYLDKTPEGKMFGDYLETKFEPFAKQRGQEVFDNLTSAGVDPAKAGQQGIRQGFKDARVHAFGKKDEALIKFVHGATKKYGLAYGNNVADGLSVYLHDSQSFWRRAKALKDVGVYASSRYKPPQAGEFNLRTLFSWAMTPFIAIPHTTQTLNLVLDAPLKAVQDGFGEAFGKLTKDQFLSQVIKSGALFDEVRYQMADDAAGGGIVRKIFHQPGFNWVRRNEIIWAAATGKHAALDAAERIVRDSGDKGAEITLKKLGLIPENIVKQEGKLTEQDILTAMYREADRTIFIRSGLTTPWKWEESAVARYASMYKHFGYRQGRFMIDTFKNSIKESPTAFLKWIGTVGILFPMAGELVHSVENLVSGKDPTERDPKAAMFHSEYIDAIAHAAGFGILYSMARAAQWHGMAAWLAGPIIGTAGDLMEDMLTANGTNLARHSLRMLPLVGRAASEIVPHGRKSAANPYVRHPVRHKKVKSSL